MAQVSFQVTVTGVGHVILPVDTLGVESVEIEGAGSASVPFVIRNPLSREVSILSMVAEVGGKSKDKMLASLLKTSVVIPAGGLVENVLTIETNEALNESDAATITVRGSEGVV